MRLLSSFRNSNDPNSLTEKLKVLINDPKTLVRAMSTFGAYSSAALTFGFPLFHNPSSLILQEHFQNASWTNRSTTGTPTVSRAARRPRVHARNRRDAIDVVRRVILMLHADVRAGFCAAATPPLLLPHPRPGTVASDEAALASVAELPASNGRLVAEDLIQSSEPVLLRGAFASSTTTWAELSEEMRGDELASVTLTHNHHYMPSDATALLHPFVQSYHAPHMVHNLSAELVLNGLGELALMGYHGGAVANARANETARRREFWRCSGGQQLQQQRPFGGRRLIWFGDMPKLKAKLERKSAVLYASAFDAKAGLQSAWLSSPGARTHTHFDNDRNFFVQLIGRKRFVMWPPNQTQHLCPYPRLHPLWHKSRVDFEAPDARAPPCDTYNQSEAIGVDVAAGDVLYIPPFWWHTVETISPSLSLSTLSRWPQLYNHLNALYTHEYLFDALRPHASRVYALRTFLVELMRTMSAPDLMRNLVAQYQGLEGLFPPQSGRRSKPLGRRGARRAEVLEASSSGRSSSAFDAPASCVIDERGTPVCRWCLSRIRFEVNVAWDEHLRFLPADVRNVVLPEFIEEISAEAVGAAQVLNFWDGCFGDLGSRQPFFLTKGGSDEHLRLWTTKDHAVDGKTTKDRKATKEHNNEGA